MPATRSRDKGDVLEQASPRSDAYTGMLIVSLLATITGILFLWLDYREYPPDQKPPAAKAPVSQMGGGARTTGVPAPVQQPPPGNQGATPPVTK